MNCFLSRTDVPPSKESDRMDVVNPFDPLVDLIAESVVPKLAAFPRSDGVRHDG